jgi:hypothetical protein
MQPRNRVNNYITIKLGSLHIIGMSIAKPSWACVIQNGSRHNPRPAPTILRPNEVFILSFMSIYTYLIELDELLDLI